MKTDPQFDVKWNGKLKKVMYLNLYVVAKPYVKAVVKKQINEIATMMHTAYLRDKDGNPIGSGWKIQSIE